MSGLDASTPGPSVWAPVGLAFAYGFDSPARGTIAKFPGLLELARTCTQVVEGRVPDSVGLGLT
jgi:hypothetical protein